MGMNSNDTSGSLGKDEFKPQKKVKTYLPTVGKGETGSFIGEPDESWALPGRKITTLQFDDRKVSVFDVAAYIIKKMGPVSAMKLHKLIYYCQAWSLVWDERPLFQEKIEAWANGPVIRDLFVFHR